MKLDEIVNYDSPRTFAGVHFDPATVKSFVEFSKSNKIPNPVGESDFHTTLLHSRKPLPNYQPIEQYDQPMIGHFSGFEVWPSTPDDASGESSNVLVLRFQSPALYQRHHYLVNKHGATVDFDQYRPHVTLSYNAGDFDHNKLPDFEHELTIIGEYSEDLRE